MTMYELSVSVIKLNRVLSGFIQTQIDHAGIPDLHPSYAVILLPLLKEEGLTLSKLASGVFMKAPTITILANKLEKLGWIRRKKGSVDRRQVLLYLTPSGRKKARSLASIRRKILRKMSNGISKEMVNQAVETLNKVIENVYDVTE